MANLIGHYENANGDRLYPILSGAASAIEYGQRASQAYSKGSYLYYKNKLCKAITSISYNDTFVIGTNLEQVYLCDELSSHCIASNGEEFSFQTLIDGGYE